MADTRLVTNTGLYRATRLIGSSVENLAGEPLGTLKDVVIDLGDSRVAAAILSLPGKPDAAEALVAVPLSAVGFDPADERCLLNVSLESLRQAPAFRPDGWPEMLDRVWAADVCTRWGCAPYGH